MVLSVLKIFEIDQKVTGALGLKLSVRDYKVTGGE